MADSESKGRRRISVELPDSLVNRLDELKDEWGVRARGECITRLLEQIFNSEDEDDESNQEEIETESQFSELLNKSGESSEEPQSSKSSNHQIEARFSEDRALVLIREGALVIDVEQETISQASTAPSGQKIGVNKGGIDLPGFVRKRTSEIRESLHSRQESEAVIDTPVLPTVEARVLSESATAAREHWIGLYGTPAGDTVLEAAMTWLRRDIWPNADGTEGRAFTWSQTLRVIDGVCPGWLDSRPQFDQVIVVAGVLEDPFATSELVHRIPTLIRRFVNRFKRSRKVTSFETLENTMTVHGALKLLKLPTIAGASLTLKTIREAYKQEAMATHPDAGGSTEAMRRLNEAYQMLRELYRQKSA